MATDKKEDLIKKLVGSLLTDRDAVSFVIERDAQAGETIRCDIKRPHSEVWLKTILEYVLAGVLGVSAIICFFKSIAKVDAKPEGTIALTNVVLNVSGTITVRQVSGEK